MSELSPDFAAQLDGLYQRALRDHHTTMAVLNALHAKAVADQAFERAFGHLNPSLPPPTMPHPLHADPNGYDSSDDDVRRMQETLERQGYGR